MGRQAACPRCSTTGGAARGDTGGPRARIARARDSRTAAATPGARGQARPERRARQCAESTVAVGFVLTERPHLSELAARPNAGLDPRLRHDSRTDASEADG